MLIQEPEAAKETIQIWPISNTLLFTINDLNLLASEISERQEKNFFIITENGNNSYQHVFSDNKSDAENLPLQFPGQ